MTTNSDVPRMVQLNLTEEETFYLISFFKLGLAAVAGNAEKQMKLALVIMIYRDGLTTQQTVRSVGDKLAAVAKSVAGQLGTNAARAEALDSELDKIISELKGR